MPAPKLSSASEGTLATAPVAFRRESDREIAARWILALSGALALGALAISAAFAPEAIAAGAPWNALGVSLPLCPGCPLCGMTRAFSAASHLHLEQALAFNRGVAIAYPLALTLPVSGAAIWIRHLFERN